MDLLLGKLVELLPDSPRAGVLLVADLHLGKPAHFSMFGAPVPEAGQRIGSGDLLANSAQYEGEDVLLTTRIAKVCQKKGCFFVAQHGADSVRVTFKDYGFFIPSDSGGKTVTLAGIFERKPLSPEQAAHLAEDMGEAPPENPPANGGGDRPYPPRLPPSRFSGFHGIRGPPRCLPARLAAPSPTASRPQPAAASSEICRRSHCRKPEEMIEAERSTGGDATPRRWECQPR